MNHWKKTIAAVTMGAAFLTVSALTTAQPSTSASQGASLPGASDSTKVPAATQPGGAIQGGDSATTPAMSQSEPSSKSRKTTTKDTGMSSTAMKGERVRSVQEALKSKGYDPGPIDGFFGPKTKAALKDFRKAESPQESRRQDPQTLAKLGVQ